MYNNELDNVDNELDNANNEVDTDKDKDGIHGGLIEKIMVLLVAIATFLGLKNLILKKKLKEEREKNAAFQEVIREHQAEIDVLTSEKERQEYLIHLYQEFISKMEK